MSKFQKISSLIGFGVLIGFGIIVTLRIIKKLKKHKIVRGWIYADGEEPICI